MKNRFLGSTPRSKAKKLEKVLYKQSNLKLDMRTREVRLMPVCFPEMTSGIGMNADAGCQYNGMMVMALGDYEVQMPRHHRDSPSRLCSCGFHAYNEYSDARTHNQDGQLGLVVLRVIASGKMFEYNKGYRYGHQRVEEIIVSYCEVMGCFNSADRFLRTEKNHLLPVCSRHTKFHRGAVVMSFAELGEVASKSLPTSAPRITVRNDDPLVCAWERDIETPSSKEPIETKDGFFQRSPVSVHLVGVGAACTGLTLFITSVAQGWF